jgi:glycosidase
MKDKILRPAHYLALLFMLSSWGALEAQDAPQKVDPPFWWIGMNNTELQLMVYGESIGTLRPSIEYEGVTIKRTVLVENANYAFVYLNIEPEARPGTFPIDFINKKGKVGFRCNYNLLERSIGAAEIEGYDNSDAIYLITPDRFANGDPGNDNMEGLIENSNRSDEWGRHGGDIRGMANQLDYISQLGFTAIWINPLLENNQEKSSYHGYSTTDFYRIDPRFGTNEEYRNLSIQAGEKGLKVIMDMIVNHCGSNHWWMQDLPSGDWVNNPDDPFFTSHRRTTIRDPYASKYDLEQFVDGWFVPTMPDLNQRNPLMATYLVQNAIWWIEYIGLAGIRMDTYSYSGSEFMSQWTCAIMEEYPHFNMVGEEWSLDPAVIAYWQEGKVNPDGYVSCLPGLLDFPLQDALTKALTEEEAWNSGMVNLYTALSNDFLYADPFKHVIFPDNHDMSRIFTQLNEDIELWKMAIVYFATMRGTPTFYYGTEILMSNLGNNSHGNIRSDFPGGWVGDKINGFTGKELTDNQKEVMNFFNKVLNWRKDAEIIHQGSLMHYAPSNGVYFFFRYITESKVMVVLNKSEQEQSVELEPLFEMVRAGERGTEVLSGEEISFGDGLVVGAKQAMIIEIH